MIYFVRDGKYVKIGYTQDADRFRTRLSSLQVGNPRMLEVLALMSHGGPRTESELHRLFAPWRVGGEWFELSTPVKHAVRVATEGGLPQDVLLEARTAVARSQATRKKCHGARREDRPRKRSTHLNPKSSSAAKVL